MRYIVKPKTASALNWLLDIDSTPGALPVFPETDDLGLVVAHLVSGSVLAEVIPHRGHFKKACGEGLPLGRLYFQIPRDRLYSVCADLTPDSFLGGDAA